MTSTTARGQWVRERGGARVTKQGPGMRGSGACPGLTLMRSPVVKRHTTPRSGFFCYFFPLHWSWRHRPLTTCSDLISIGGPRHTGSAPNTS